MVEDSLVLLAPTTSEDARKTLGLKLIFCARVLERNQ
jgi:hypothetical protein